MKMYLAIAFLIITSACSKESITNSDLPKPFCAWRFKNQDYVSMMGGVQTDSTASALFYTQDTIYPYHTLSFTTSSLTPGEYPIDSFGSSNTLVYNMSASLDSMTSMNADTGVVRIKSLTNGYISNTFIAVFGSDILSGHCDYLKLQ